MPNSGLGLLESIARATISVKARLSAVPRASSSPNRWETRASKFYDDVGHGGAAKRSECAGTPRRRRGWGLPAKIFGSSSPRESSLRECGQEVRDRR